MRDDGQRPVTIAHHEHFCSIGRKGLSKFGRGTPREHACVIISKSIHWFRRRSCLKFFSIFSSGSHLVQGSKTVCAILVEGHPANIPELLFQNPATGFWQRSHLKVFIFLTLVAILLNGVEQSNFGTGLTEEHSCEIISKSVHQFSRRNPLKLCSIYSSCGHFVQRSRTA